LFVEIGMRRSLEGEQHLSVAIVPGGVAYRFAVIRKRVGPRGSR
jgi:hypothetical protein